MSKQDVYRFKIYIGASPARVWDAIVSPEGLWKPLYGAWIESSFKAGEKLEYLGPGNQGDRTVHIYGTVLEYKPFETFSYLEYPGPSYYPNHADLSSRTTFSLEPVEDSTKLTVTSDQWAEGHPSQDKSEEEWAMVLSQLKSFVETGTILKLW